MKGPLVILGAGIGGLSVARELTLRGETNLIVLGHSQGARCASAVAMGVSAVKGMYAAETGLFQDKLAGHDALRKVLNEWGIATDALVAEPFLDRDYYQYLSERVFRRHFTAPWGVGRASREEVEPRVPQVFGDGVLGVLTYPSDYWFDPATALATMRTRLEAAGVRFVASEMASLSEEEEGWSIGAENGWSCVSDRVFVVSGPSLEEHAARFGFVAGKWKQSPGVTLKAPHTQKNAWALLHKTASIGASPHTLWAGPLKDDETLSTALDQWTPYLSESTAATFRDAPWGVQKGVRMRVQELHHRPFAAVKQSGTKMCALLGGFHKSGWQLAPIYAERLVTEWMAKS